jgi:hypothetical protein
MKVPSNCQERSLVVEGQGENKGKMKLAPSYNIMSMQAKACL